MWETRAQSPGWEVPLENGMASLSSILTWRISWTKEPNRLQSMGHKELDTTERQTLLLLMILKHELQNVLGEGSLGLYPTYHTDGKSESYLYIHTPMYVCMYIGMYINLEPSTYTKMLLTYFVMGFLEIYILKFFAYILKIKIHNVNIERKK